MIDFPPSPGAMGALPRSVAVPQLHRLSAAVVDAGWSSCPRFDEDPPRLLVFHPKADQVGLVVTVVPHPFPSDPHTPWYRLSNGQLIPCSDLAYAVTAITTHIGRHISGLVPEAAAAPAPKAPGPEQIRALLQQAGVRTWRGEATHSWWALVPNAVDAYGFRGPQLVEAGDLEGLPAKVQRACGRRS